MEWLIAIIVRPLALLLVIAMLIPVRLLILRFLPNGKIKRILLTPVKGYPGYESWKRRLQESGIDSAGKQPIRKV